MNKNKIYSFPLWLRGGITYLLYKGDSHRQMGIKAKVSLKITKVEKKNKWYY
jgi:hypothetical protein